MITRFEVFTRDELKFETYEDAEAFLEADLGMYPEDIWEVEDSHVYESGVNGLFGYFYRVARIVPDAQDME